MEQPITINPNEPVAFNSVQLNKSSELLINTLPDHVSELIKAMAQEYDIQLWHLVAGILLEVHSEGRLSSFQLYPDWQDGMKQTMHKCTECKEFYKPKRIGQLYCTNECASIAEGRKLAEEHKKEVIREEIQETERMAALKEQLKELNKTDDRYFEDNTTDITELPSVVDASDSGWSFTETVSQG